MGTKSNFVCGPVHLERLKAIAVLRRRMKLDEISDVLSCIDKAGLAELAEEWTLEKPESAKAYLDSIEGSGAVEISVHDLDRPVPVAALSKEGIAQQHHAGKIITGPEAVADVEEDALGGRRRGEFNSQIHGVGVRGTDLDLGGLNEREIVTDADGVCRASGTVSGIEKLRVPLLRQEHCFKSLVARWLV